MSCAAGAIEQAIAVTGTGRTLDLVLNTAERLVDYVRSGPPQFASEPEEPRAARAK